MAKPVAVLLFDPLTAVPYYAAALTASLERRGVAVQLAAITYYLDRGCFSMAGVRNSPGILDLVGRFNLPRTLRRAAKLLELALNLLALSLRFRKAPPAVVHVQYLPLLRTSFPLDYAFVRWLQRKGSRVVYTVHDLLPHDTGESFLALYSKIYKEVDALVCHTASAREELVYRFGVDPERIYTIPHGPLFSGSKADSTEAIRQSYRLKESDLVVLWQGLIFPYKGVDFLLESWPAVLRDIPNARLIVAGTGDPTVLASLTNQIEALALKESVRTRFEYIPEEELSQLYTLADCVVFPYKAISTSGALMTAISFQKPIITTDLPYFREVLEEGKYGRLVRYGDTEQLAAEIASLLLSPEKRQALQLSLSQKMDSRKQWDQIAAKTLDCYRKVEIDTLVERTLTAK